ADRGHLPLRDHEHLLADVELRRLVRAELGLGSELWRLEPWRRLDPFGAILAQPRRIEQSQQSQQSRPQLGRRWHPRRRHGWRRQVTSTELRRLRSEPVSFARRHRRQLPSTGSPVGRQSMAITQRRMTLEEFLELPEEEPALELID